MNHRDEIANLLHERDRPELYRRPVEQYEAAEPLLARLWTPLAWVVIGCIGWIIAAAVVALVAGVGR